MSVFTVSLKQAPLAVEQVRGQVLEMLATGDYKSGDRLVSEKKLAEILGSNHVTVRKALLQIARDGFIKRRPRSGTYVCRVPSFENVGKFTLVTLVMRTRGHLYADMSSEFCRQLQRSKRMPVLASYEKLGDLKHVAACVGDAIDMGCRELIIEPGVFSFDELKTMVTKDLSRRLNGVVWVQLMGEFTVPGDSVCLDLEDVAGEVVDHLVSRGHRRITALTHGTDPLRPAGCPSGGTRFAEVFLAAMAEAGLAKSADVVWRLGEEDAQKRQLKEMLNNDRRPTAVFACADWDAVKAKDAAEELGLRVPEDLAIVGFFNTPWADRYNLTSVSPEIPSVVREAIRLSAAPDKERVNRRIVQVKTKLIVRESSGGRQ
ncbi:MAG: GntR family transcriptional regulator [Kiritimatiellae bacterium]|nr:GntR family transcriptional regulator [Verrucomicrobiota bacterium]MBU4366970.1 GntR family transcriptional regulator [Verrucomicrobiota bacterium]MCG2659438.1 GntR family transcriptional regulator [Kiritimatiellia bacterium]